MDEHDNRTHSKKGPVDTCVVFSQCCTPVVGESLQVNNKDFGKRPKVKLLCGLLMLLAGWTIPEGK